MVFENPTLDELPIADEALVLRWVMIGEVLKKGWERSFYVLALYLSQCHVRKNRGTEPIKLTHSMKNSAPYKGPFNHPGHIL